MSRGWGPLSIHSCLGWETFDCAHRLSCKLAGVAVHPRRGHLCSYQGLEGLTHTKCSLGVHLKALRTANLIFFCKAKGGTLRKPVSRGILGLLLGLVQAVATVPRLSPSLEPHM